MPQALESSSQELVIGLTFDFDDDVNVEWHGYPIQDTGRKLLVHSGLE